MFKGFKANSILMLAAGLCMGLLFGVGMLVGALAATSYFAESRIEFPETALHATASHGGNSLALATGSIDEESEGLFVLDYLTGDLQCWVLNSRTGTFLGQFKHNVVADLGIEKGKQPDYAMVTGTISPRGFSGNVKPANSVLYVADCNSGNVAVYAVPWNRSAAAAFAPQTGAMTRLAVGKGRNVITRE
jgi:hypothetical protein